MVSKHFRHLRLLGAAALLGASVVGTTGLVHAAADTQLPGYVCGTAPGEGNLTVCLRGDTELVPTGPTTTAVVATCTAVVEGVVETTGVGCELFSLGGAPSGAAPNLFEPGVVSASGFAESSIPLQSYQLCVGGDYTTVDGGRGSGAVGTWAFSACFTTL